MPGVSGFTSTGSSAAAVAVVDFSNPGNAPCPESPFGSSRVASVTAEKLCRVWP